MAVPLFCVTWRGHSPILSIRYVIAYIITIWGLTCFGWNESINLCGILYLIRELIGKGLSKWKLVWKKTSSRKLQGILVALPCVCLELVPWIRGCLYSSVLILFVHGHNRYGNKILVTDELPDGQMVDQWEPVSCDSVKTPLEVWLKLV